MTLFGIYFNVFISKSTLFGEWFIGFDCTSLGFSWVQNFTKKINLVYIKSIYVILNIFRKEMVYRGVIWYFFITTLDRKCYVSFSNH